MSWRPPEQTVQAILKSLHESRTGVTAVTQNATRQLETMSQQLPEFNNCLVYILNLKNVDQDLRQVAGLLLKTNISKAINTTEPNSKQMLHIKQLLFEVLSDPSPSIRNTAGNIISMIVFGQSLKNWNGVIQALMQLLDSPDPNTVDGAMSTIYKICEDDGKELVSEEFGNPVQFLLPRLLKFFSHKVDSVRRDAISSVVHFFKLWPPVLAAYFDTVLDGIFFLAQDQNKQVRKQVCIAFTSLVERAEFLKKHFNKIAEYMLLCTKDVADEAFALDACDFWNAIAEADNSELNELLKPFLPRLIPILLSAMVYSEMERAYLEHEAEQPRKDSEVAPFIHQPRVVMSNAKNAANYDDEEDEDEYDDEEEFDIDSSNSWNLRKCAAATLDLFACTYGNAILPILIPKIQEKTQQNLPWEVRESAILALGAIAEGCRTGMETSAHSLILFLISMLNDPKPLVRSITCWTISRYAKFITEQPPEQYFAPALQGIMKCINDSSKRVQESACSSFCTLTEAAQTKIVPYLKPIVTFLASAFELYHKKSLVLLYDAISTLADTVRTNLNQPEIISILMPPLVYKWQKLDNSDEGLFPLLECYSSISTALKHGFIPFAKPVWSRCITLIGTTYQEEEIAKKIDKDYPDKDFIVCSLDLLSAIVDALGPTVESLVKESGLLNLLVKAVSDEADEVKQSAFGLVGDLAKTCIGVLREMLGHIITQMVPAISGKHVAVTNNAIWAIGEIAVQVKKEISPCVNEVMKQLIPIMQNQQLNAGLLENTAITIGRLGWACPELVAPTVQYYCKTWCIALRGIRNLTEKEHSYRGLCHVIRANPGAFLQDFAYLVEAFTSYSDAKPDFLQEFGLLLKGYKDQMGAQKWYQYIQQFKPETQNVLVNVFKL